MFSVNLFVVFFVVCIKEGLFVDDFTKLNTQRSQSNTEIKPDSNAEENRPPFYQRFQPFFRNQQQQADYSQRPYEPFQQRVDNNYYASYNRKREEPEDSRSSRASALGSENFGVIKGGTFYREDNDAANNYQDDYYYQNGHSKPQFYHRDNPRPYKYEQFENFRDFADINAPSYSEYVVIYAHKNDPSKNTDSEIRANNVLERLEIIDKDEALQKLSKRKQKLKLEHDKHENKLLKLKEKTTKIKNENIEPLLALS